MGPPLLVGQMVGLLPVENITDTGADLVFKWWSARSIFAASIIGLSLFELALACRRFIKLGFSLGGITVIFFYFSTTSTATLMYHLAGSGRWRRMMQQFERMEKTFTDESLYPQGSLWTLRRKIGVLSCIWIVAAAVEHGFYVLAKMTNVWSQIKKCNFKVSLYEHFLRTERKHIYAAIPFNYYLAIPLEITNTCNTIAWTFLDLFIMIYSIALAHRFKQLSRRIRRILLQVRLCGLVWYC